MPITTYAGTELDVFAHARNWKRYLRDTVTPWLRGDVLEVGGGIGETTCAFRSGAQSSWMALEPDPRLAARLAARVSALPNPVRVVAGTLDSLAEAPLFDCIIYIDVLEHIEQDGAELRSAAARLRTGGAIVVMSPAHQSLYTPFDAAIGHHRRYNRKQMTALTPPGTHLAHLAYLDAVGLTLTVGNRLVLKSASPTVSQVLLWDRWCIPVSRVLDPLIGGRLGKSILAVWRKEPPPP
jgi:2-polyprenyl-3-methyl-5-hydroxy-6-metoxy-1,4-benzoquinol methylase